MAQALASAALAPVISNFPCQVQDRDGSQKERVHVQSAMEIGVVGRSAFNATCMRRP